MFSARVSELETQCENHKISQRRAEREVEVHQAKFNAVQEFYSKRDVELQG